MFSLKKSSTLLEALFLARRIQTFSFVAWSELIFFTSRGLVTEIYYFIELKNK